MNWDEKYFAVYDAACSLEIIVEDLQAGIQPSRMFIDDAKSKLLRLAALEPGKEFFGRFNK